MAYIKMKSKYFRFVFSFILFPLSFFIFCSNPSSPDKKPTRPQIEVQSPITEDTVWESGNDYLIYGEVVVEENATLTIRKNVNVFLGLDDEDNKGKLLIKGRILADGEDSTTAIVFGPEEGDDSGEGSWGVEIQEGKSLSSFVYCNFKYCSYGVYSIDTYLNITNCIFDNCKQGLNVSESDSVGVSNSSFSYNSTGIKMELVKGPTGNFINVVHNYFYKCNDIGIEIKNRSNILFTDNYLKDCNTGILCSYDSEAIVKYNECLNCVTGIYFHMMAKGRIERNILQENNVGILISFSANPTINKNNFVNSTNFHLRCDQHYPEGETDRTIDAKENWWGTDQKDEIELKIHDSKDIDLTQLNATVDFEPFETNLVDSCGVRVL